MTPHIVVIGSLNMDLVVRAPRHPRPGETLIGDSFRTIPGGKGANQAVAAARMGANVTMIGSAGADAFGDELIGALVEAKVNVGRIARASIPTGVALITVSAAGENTIVIVPGANGTITGDQIVASEALIASADAILLQLEIPMEAVRVAAELGHKHRVPVLLNPAPADPRVRALLPFVTYVIPNEHEAALLTGSADGEQQSPTHAADLLRVMGAQSVIVTMGALGALLLIGPTPVQIPAFPVQVVDSTAAGDAFVGAFAVALSEGLDPAESTRWGCAAGGLACTTLGAQPSLPRREEVEILVRQY